MEVKMDDDPDVKQYIHTKEIIPTLIKGNDILIAITSKLNILIHTMFTWLLRVGIGKIFNNLISFYLVPKHL